MGSWGCPHESNGVCQRVNKLPCDPGMKGCVLYGRFVFSNPAKNGPVHPDARNKTEAQSDQPVRREDPWLESGGLKERAVESGLVRCPWAQDDLMKPYHDAEWGVPVHDDRLLFEFLTLEGAQAGLSWSTILKKREAYRTAFDRFDPRKVARFDAARLEGLLTNTGIVRNRLKIAAAVQNARAFVAVQKECGSFDAYIWTFVGGKPIRNAWKRMDEVPTRTPESDTMSKDLTKRGFTFAGSTICYAFMQAVGMVNDHLVSCFRYAGLNR